MSQRSFDAVSPLARCFSTSSLALMGLAGLGVGLGEGMPVFSSSAYANSSPAPYIQFFEATYETQVERIPDVFMAGYGVMWVPPTGRASTGSFSAGYDPRDRFDLGQWNDKTLYGTEDGLRTLAARMEQTGGAVLSGLIWNHNGFQYDDTPGFIESGAYPGMVVQNPDGGGDPFGVPGTNGDFHSPFAGGFDSRFIGLIDIDHGSNHQLIRNPVDPNNPQNIPAGTSPFDGRIANQPDPNNARFYPDRDLDPIFVFNPSTGESDIAIYPFNNENPLAGDPVPENALGYLMRQARWMVEEIGVEGFRLDIPWHFPEYVLGYFDQAVYRASERRNLDGSQYHSFSIMEAGRGDLGEINRRFVNQNIDPNDPGRIGSNYNALDFEFYHAVEENFTNNGLQNDWRRVAYTSLDVNDDGIVNGSAGIKFVASHDDVAPFLSNVAHAYALMLPGQATVYFNAKQHGEGRDFPRGSRGDVLGGVFGGNITTLLDIRNTHGRGLYFERSIDKETLIYERGGSALVGLSNRLDGGYTERRVDVDLPWGTYLVELTGNSQFNGDIPDLVRVDDDFFEGPTKATIRVPHNNGGDTGYVIYGLPRPVSAEGIEFSQPGSVPVTVLEGSVPDANNFDNGNTRLTDLHVITEDQFTLSIATQPVTLQGTRLVNGQMITDTYRDRDADGDNALFKVDGGLNLNDANPFNTLSGVDFDQPGQDVIYGFEQFLTTNQSGFADPDGNGFYEQVIDTSLLSEGEHYVTARVFRHRDDGGPAIYQDFKKVIYVDRLDPISGVDEVIPVNGQGSGDHDVLFESLDQTADSIHAFVNLPASVSDEEALNMALSSQGGSEKVDISLFKSFFSGLAKGNNVFTIVTFEPTGNSNVQRITGQFLDAGIGAGFGDLNHDGVVDANDLSVTSFSFENVLYSQDTIFNPAADLDGNGKIGWQDLLLLEQALTDAAVSQGTMNLYNNIVRRRGNVDQVDGTNSFDIGAIFDRIGTNDWFADIDSSGTVDEADIDALLSVIFNTFRGDANLDGRVDEADLDILTANFSQSGKHWALGDFNGDGITNFRDVTVFADFWYAHDPSAAPFGSQVILDSFAIPTPSSLSVAVVGGMMLLRRRRA